MLLLIAVSFPPRAAVGRAIRRSSAHRAVAPARLTGSLGPRLASGRSLAIFAIALVALILADAVASPSSAQTVYRYEARTAEPVLETGAVRAGSLVWQCRDRVCTISGPWPVPGVSACQRLASEVGRIVSYGHPRQKLSAAQLETCNANAAQPRGQAKSLSQIQVPPRSGTPAARLPEATAPTQRPAPRPSAPTPGVDRAARESLGRIPSVDPAGRDAAGRFQILGEALQAADPLLLAPIQRFEILSARQSLEPQRIEIELDRDFPDTGHLIILAERGGANRTWRPVVILREGRRIAVRLPTELSAPFSELDARYEVAVHNTVRDRNVSVFTDIKSAPARPVAIDGVEVLAYGLGRMLGEHEARRSDPLMRIVGTGRYMSPAAYRVFVSLTLPRRIERSGIRGIRGQTFEATLSAENGYRSGPFELTATRFGAFEIRVDGELLMRSQQVMGQDFEAGLRSEGRVRMRLFTPQGRPISGMLDARFPDFDLIPPPPPSIARDDDGDGVGDERFGGADCDDSDPRRFFGNTEVADDRGFDEDCDPMTIGDLDRDGDGYKPIWLSNRAHFPRSPVGRDCDDNNIQISPRSPEVCDLIDNDCDGDIDEGVQILLYRDADGDGFGRRDDTFNGCLRHVGQGFSQQPGDCDDGDPRVVRC